MRNVLAYVIGLAIIELPVLALCKFNPSKIGWGVLIVIFIVYSARFSDNRSSHHDSSDNRRNDSPPNNYSSYRDNGKVYFCSPFCLCAIGFLS
jgi:hypothetical protein